MDTLFDLDAKPAFNREALRERLNALEARGIFIGGSSWKYEGWLGQIYTRSRYRARGRFSRRAFEETCLSEYAEVFPAVCGDFAFYRFPARAFLAKLFAQTPETFRWGFKVPEQITTPVWPVHPRYGTLAGRENPAFLDFTLFEEAFLRALEPYRRQVGVMIFEFGPLLRCGFDTAKEFAKALDPFLERLPPGWRFAVEIRNAEFLAPEYFACLRAHEITHVYNEWTRMPDIETQMAIPESHTAETIVARALLRRGRLYEEAVREFTPYDRVREVNETARRGLRELVEMARVDGRPAFIFVNNRLEGNSPATIVSITD